MSLIDSPSYQWIATPRALDDACAQMAAADAIALDTEFFREKTFYPLPALFQFAAGGMTWLVDPLAVECTPACRALLQNDALKLIHACSEDLEVFQRWAGVLPAPLMDTQVAQGFLSDNPGMGYQKLVEHWLGETLPKEETRSDWLKRPLSRAQCDYAALDVICLLEVWKRQAEALERSGRMDWALAQCRALVEQAGRGADQDARWFTRQRQLWRLTPRQIEAYRLMTTWREGEIRRRDLPRNWLVSDKVLFAVAAAMPKNRFELAAIEEVKPSLVKKEGDTLLALMQTAREREEEALPRSWPDPAQPPFKPLFKALKKTVSDRAAALGMAPEMLLRRRDIEAIAMQALAGESPRLPGGWRGECLNSSLKQTLEEMS
ncbi:ribonuclease D [Halomonas piscis]|uniref:ribonuclease D n=1 Tax=Halomonas piscis TaxID=3031727 RepID=UPI00289DD5E0|nr:ribonuclease D [Halomonas piscis]